MYISLLCIFKQNYRSHPVYGSHGIPAELFQILKDDAVKGLHSTFQQVWKAQEWQQDWKRSVSILIPKKGNAKECSNYHTIALISDTSKVMLKILQVRLQQYMNRELPDVQAGFRKGRRTRDQLPTSVQSQKKQENSRKTSTSASLIILQPLLCGSQQTMDKSSRDGNTRPPYLPPEKSVCRSTSNSYNWTWNNWLVPN